MSAYAVCSIAHCGTIIPEVEGLEMPDLQAAGLFLICPNCSPRVHLTTGSA